MPAGAVFTDALLPSVEAATAAEAAHGAAATSVPSTRSACSRVASTTLPQLIILPTAFASCNSPQNPSEIFNVGSNIRRYGRRFFGLDGIPCRHDEEESCNSVHATCSRVLKVSTVEEADPEARTTRRPGPPCQQPEPADQNEMPKDKKPAARGGKSSGVKSLFGKLAARSLEAAKGGAGTLLSPGMQCNARTFDMPHGLYNNEAGKLKKRSLLEILNPSREAPAEASLPESVWGVFVGGKSGTWGFGADSPRYLYQLPQGRGAAADYYICDSPDKPHHCALIGGNMRRACAEWYDPGQCSECEDLGTSLRCDVRGWNEPYKHWARVPIYPRDLLGELHPDEWRDVLGRPLFASVVFPKDAFMGDVKMLPEYLVDDDGPASKAHAVSDVNGAAPPPSIAAVSAGPDIEGWRQSVSAMLEIREGSGGIDYSASDYRPGRGRNRTGLCTQKANVVARVGTYFL
eukprot:TRINITY_DN68726_c0_g1_i1.p1 TRINITY_DN68726_c0_g1~~TRINITY_DN68726_c0_g1_i1.p1  ORF type:complete len:473 (-),score=68.01 TRINITY_DN68726_c0_g1_i1:63-1445(-)